MTVITKPLNSEKKPDKVPLVLPVNAEGLDAEKGGQANQRLNERYHYVLRNRASRVSGATMLCLIITALLVMTVGLFGGLYLYKQVSRARLQKWRGWCNVPYYSESPSPYQSGRIDSNFQNSDLNDPLFGITQQLENGAKKIDDDGMYNNWLESDDDSPQQTAADFFREEFEIDLEDEKYSKVEVPDFKNGRLGRFIHEFDSNKTAIVDQSGKRCFIMPLDRERILPPKSMYDMIEKMWKGYYSVNTQRVRESMRIVLPALNDLSDMGEYIQNECEDKTTYRLEKATGKVFKRSVANAHDALPFTEFAGLFTIDYDIVNLNQIEKQEQH